MEPSCSSHSPLCSSKAYLQRPQQVQSCSSSTPPSGAREWRQAFNTRAHGGTAPVQTIVMSKLVSGLMIQSPPVSHISSPEVIIMAKRVYKQEISQENRRLFNFISEIIMSRSIVVMTDKLKGIESPSEVTIVINFMLRVKGWAWGGLLVQQYVCISHKWSSLNWLRFGKELKEELL